jgi:predicted transcriptional regulator
VAAYVEQEMAIVRGMEQGLADVKVGRLVSHDQGMEEVYEAISQIETGA